MKHRLLMLALVVCAALISTPAALSQHDDHARHYYVALGDSAAEGYQPVVGTGQGYVDQLYAALEVDDPTLALVNLACGGETTSSVITGVMPWGAMGARSFCGYRADSAQLAHGSQLADAVSFLRAHRGFVSLVTLDIGGNDLWPCFEVLDFSTDCASPYIERVRTNLSTVLEVLREAAGPDVPIVGMNYYDPFLGLWVWGMPALALDSVDTIVQLNNALETTYASYGLPVADVETAFAVTEDPTNTTDLSGYGTLPLSVYNACTLTWACSLLDIHPNTAGYGVIAQAFLSVLNAP